MSAPTLTSALRSPQLWASQPFVTRVRRQLQVFDVVMVVLAIGLSMVLGWGGGGSLLHDHSRQVLSAALLILWPAILWQRQSTATTILGQGLEEYRRVIVSSVVTVTFAAALAYWTDTTRARGFLLGAFTVGTALLVIERHVMRLRLHRQMEKGNFLHRVFVIAAPPRQTALRSALDAKDGRFAVVGVHHLNGAATDPQVIIDEALAAEADTIIYAPLGTEDSQWTRQLGWAMEDHDLSLLVSPSLVEIAGPRLSVEPVEGMALVRVDMPRFSGPARVAKRALDIVGATFFLAVLGIPMLVIAALIRMTSKGPALFKQTRAGIRSQTFVCWKFRTMYTGADADRAALRDAARSMADGATFKMADDPRVTGIGKWLRRFSLDELPQLVNVLRGEMSLVGPRPHPLDDVELYDDVATRRLLAKPGMTGLWQVSGRSDLDWEQAVRLDLYYVENWSISADVLILARTLKVVATGSGAY